MIPVMIEDAATPEQGSIYAPGSTVMLTCSADGRFGPVVITWTSTCRGNCFVLQQSAQDVIMKNALHSVDEGNHTCNVVDDFGNTGNSTFEIEVTGMP